MAKFASTDAFLEVEMTPGMADYQRVLGGITHSMAVDNGVTDTSDKDENRFGSEESFGKRIVTIPVEGFVSDDTVAYRTRRIVKPRNTDYGPVPFYHRTKFRAALHQPAVAIGRQAAVTDQGLEAACSNAQKTTSLRN